MSIYAITQAFRSGFREAPKSLVPRKSRLWEGFQSRKTWEYSQTSSFQYNPVKRLATFASIPSCCDAGFDMDDYGAIKIWVDPKRLKVILSRFLSEKLRHSDFYPFKIESRSLSRIYELRSRIYNGYGFDEYYKPDKKNKCLFFSRYFRSPERIFGDPTAAPDAKYRCIYPYQLQPFVDNGGPEELKKFMQQVDGEKKPIVYVCAQSAENLSRLLQQYPEKVKGKIKTIVMMDAFAKKKSENGEMDIEVCQMVKESGIPYVILPSKLCANYLFPKELMQKMAANRKKLSPFGKLFHDIILSWEVHVARKKIWEIDLSGSFDTSFPILADPLSMLFALHPDCLGRLLGYSYAGKMTSPIPICDLKIERDSYNLVYDGQHKQPRWVHEYLTSNRISGSIEKTASNFKIDPLIPSALRSTTKDYCKSGFDKGHLCPSADAKYYEEAWKSTFFLSNVSPQCPEFNQGYWVKLEKHVRNLTNQYPALHVFSGPLFMSSLNKNGRRFVKYEVIGENEVAVPTHYFKVIFDENNTPIESYILPNKRIKDTTPLDKFKTTIDKIEKVAGFVFKRN